MKNVWTQKLFRLIGGWLLSRIARGWRKKSKFAPPTKKRKTRARTEESAEDFAASEKSLSADGMSAAESAIRFFREKFEAFEGFRQNLKRPRDGRTRSNKKMNMFFRRAFDEYTRQGDLKKNFAAETERLSSILRTNGETDGGKQTDRIGFDERSPLLPLLLPLVEIAWADGRVTRREMDTIVQVAEVYGLIDDAENYRALIERMMLSRPIPNEVGRMWRDFHYFMSNLSRRERETVVFALLAQARFVAEQSADGIIGFLRGERICKNEQETLQLVAEQLEKAKTAAEESDAQKYVAAQAEKEKYYLATGAFSAEGGGAFEKVETAATKPDDYDKPVSLETAKGADDETKRRKMADAYAAVEMKMFQARSQELFGADSGGGNSSGAALDFAESKPVALLDDSDKLIPLIPLVKVAWAEGRITRRERELIFGAAQRKGIEAGSPSHARLASWLELHPTDDFYLESLERLNHGWRDLPEDEKTLLRLDLLSDCVNVAEASGGSTRYQAGGRRICDEEFAAVKRIAHKLNAPPAKSPDALISLAA